MTNNWNTSLYDEKHSFVWQRGTDLLPLLDAKTGEKILDLGCGTGHLSDRSLKVEQLSWELTVPPK